MKMTELTKVASDYDALLCRYCCMLIKNKPAAVLLVTEVFEDFYESDISMPDNVLRVWLAARVKRKAMQWLKDELLRRQRISN
jgi:hypothetical protein